MTNVAPSRAAGRSGWLLVTAATTALLIVFGVAYSFGAFLNPTAEDLSASVTSIAAVFSASSILYFTLGWPAGVLLDRFGTRYFILAGAVALVVGLGLAAQAQSALQLLLSYGLGVGISVGVIFVPVISEVTTRMTHRRSLALGCVVSGVGLGTLIGPVLAAAMIEVVGWRTTFLTFGLGGGALLALLSMAFPRTSVASTLQASSTLWQEVASRRYILLYLAVTLFSLALFVPFVHLPNLAESIGVDRVTAAASISVIGGASIVGRFGLSALSAAFGVPRTYGLCYILVLVSFSIGAMATRWWMVVVFSVILGAGYGGFVALNPLVLAERFPARHLGGLLGVLYTSSAIGAGVGPPVAGSLVDRGWSYAVVLAVCVTVMFFAFVSLLLSYRD